MIHRTLLTLALLLGLLLSPQTCPSAVAAGSFAAPLGAKCGAACCPQTVSCDCAANDASRAQPTLAPAPVAFDAAALGLYAFTTLYVLPPAEHRLAPREMVVSAHTLPRLAATCIQLI